MALPRIYQKLFQNEGAGSVLRSDILPPAQSVAVADVSIANYNVAGEYIVTGDKLASDGYPYDTSDPIYLKVINAGDTVVQYYIHNDDIQIRYKNGSDGDWSAWKSYEALIEAGDNELASQIQQLRVNAGTLLGRISILETSVSNLQGNNLSDLVDANGKIKQSAMPDVLQHNKGIFASAEEMPTDNAQAGDYCVNTTTGTVWIYDVDTSAWVDSDCKGQVTSVNGQTGDVVLDMNSFVTDWGVME